MTRKQKSTNLLCIFSRYPQVGRCKTRLIPALGATGAADLQRQMTAHIAQMGQQANCDVLCCIDGGDASTIGAWLGEDVDYVQQEGQGLGARMRHGFEVGFTRGYQHILLVGADCPDIETANFNDGFTSLTTCDLVLGPTEDGGYYLIGMKELHPELFLDMNWGTRQVLAKTLNVARDLSCQFLPTLRDIDLPEDLDTLPPFFEINRF